MKKQVFKKSDKFPNKFPSISRKITEQLQNILNYQPNLVFTAENETKRMLKILGILYLFFIFVFVLLIAIYSYYNYQNLVAEQKNIQNQIIQFEKINKAFPSHKDVLFRLAVLKYKIGDFTGAKDNLKSAILLDPNFNDAKKLLDMVEKEI